MTPRERLRTRGLFFSVTSNYPSCVKEYSELVARYAADAAARNNLALCSTYLRDWPQALSQMRAVVKILPGRALYRENLATYLSYSSDFQAGEQEARAIQDPGVFGLLALAFAQVGQGQLGSGGRHLQRAAGAIDAQGASYMASGLGDLAIYEGRFSEAERILAAGAARRREEPGLGTRRGEVRRARLCAPPAAKNGPGRRGRRRGAQGEPGREVPVPGGAHLRRGRRDRPGRADWPPASASTSSPSRAPTERSSRPRSPGAAGISTKP